MIEAAGSLEELQEMLTSAFGDVDTSGLASTLGKAMMAAHLGGRFAVEEEADV